MMTSSSTACNCCSVNLFSLLQVEVRRDGAVRRRYRAKGLTESKGPGDLVFYNEQAGRDMSVLEYFEQTYHIPCALAAAQSTTQARLMQGPMQHMGSARLLMIARCP